MRSIVIDYVRQRRAQKRGGDLTFTTLNEDHDAGPVEATNLEAVGTALDQLADLEPALAQLVDLKFFCGFTFAEDRRGAGRHRADGAARLGEGPACCSTASSTAPA